MLIKVNTKNVRLMYSFISKLKVVSTIKNLIKKSLPKDLLHLIRFLRKIPSLYKQDKLIDIHRISKWSNNKIIVSGDNKLYSIYCPDSINIDIKPNSKGITNSGFIRTYNIFVHQASAWYMRDEVDNFVRYAKKYKKFADVGSAEGFYSALFSSINKEKAEILSIDCFSEQGCDPEKVYQIKEENNKIHKTKKWEIFRAFVTDNPSIKPPWKLGENVRLLNLPDIFEELNFHPELIKMDIESSEYEVLKSSTTYLKKYMPTLIIEIHNALLSKRGLSFNNVLNDLYKIGYKLVAKDVSNYLLKGDSHIVLEHITRI